MFSDADLPDHSAHESAGMSFADQFGPGMVEGVDDGSHDHDLPHPDVHEEMGEGIHSYREVAAADLAVATDGRSAHLSATGTVDSPVAPVEGAGHAPDIFYTSADGSRIDLGAPTEDLNGDGIPESVAVTTGDGDVLVVSDTNGDGHPDQLIQIDPHSGLATWAVPDSRGGWEVVQHGHVEADGTVVVDPSSAESTPTADLTGIGEAGGAPTPGTRSDDNVEVEVSGHWFDAGPATIDTDGDGVPDTVAVTGQGGSTLYYQDTNGDGVADKAWTTDSAGQMTAEYTLAPGGNWVAAIPADRS